MKDVANEMLNDMLLLCSGKPRGLCVVVAINTLYHLVEDDAFSRVQLIEQLKELTAALGGSHVTH